MLSLWRANAGAIGDLPLTARVAIRGAGIAEASIFLANHSCAVRHNEEEE